MMSGYSNFVRIVYGGRDEIVLTFNSTIKRTKEQIMNIGVRRESYIRDSNQDQQRHRRQRIVHTPFNMN